jgi:hypothetical protein
MPCIDRVAASGVVEGSARQDTGLLAPTEYIASQGRTHKSRKTLHGAHTGSDADLLEGQSRDKLRGDSTCYVSR